MEEVLKLFTLTVRDGQMIAIGAVSFFVFWQIVRSGFFTHYLALFEERERATTGVTSAVRSIEEEAEALEGERAAKLHETRVAAVAKRLELTANARKEATSIIAKSENDIQSALKASREEIQATAARMRSDLEREVDALALQIAEKVSRAESVH